MSQPLLVLVSILGVAAIIVPGVLWINNRSHNSKIKWRQPGKPCLSGSFPYIDIMDYWEYSLTCV